MEQKKITQGTIEIFAMNFPDVSKSYFIGFLNGAKNLFKKSFKISECLIVYMTWNLPFVAMESFNPEKIAIVDWQKTA